MPNKYSKLILPNKFQLIIVENAKKVKHIATNIAPTLLPIEEKSKINTKLAKEFIRRKELLPCVQYILNQGCTKGNRNNTTVALANSLFQIGKTYEEVLEIIIYWNSEKNDEPLDRAEINTTVRSAYNNAKNGIFYGCGAFKDLDVCIKGCPIHK